MINLMYVVLMAMLAMNVSTQVLDGFSIVEESLQRYRQLGEGEPKHLRQFCRADEEHP